MVSDEKHLLFKKDQGGFNNWVIWSPEQPWPVVTPTGHLSSSRKHSECVCLPVLSSLCCSSVISNCSQLQYCVLFLFGLGLNSLQTPLKCSSLYLKPEPRIWGRTMANETKREAYGNYQPGP